MLSLYKLGVFPIRHADLILLPTVYSFLELAGIVFSSIAHLCFLNPIDFFSSESTFSK